MSESVRRSVALLVCLVIFGPALHVYTEQARAAKPQQRETRPTGRWRVSLVLGGVKEELILEARARGFGSFFMTSGSVNSKPISTSMPAVWSQNASDAMSFSGDANLPLGTCCREMGTVMFKGRFKSADSIAGKVVFVTSIDEDESPFKLRSAVGTFTATRITEGRQRAR
jgi:hypothetical protein